jgi:hypothetical protein
MSFTEPHLVEVEQSAGTLLEVRGDHVVQNTDGASTADFLKARAASGDITAQHILGSAGTTVGDVGEAPDYDAMTKAQVTEQIEARHPGDHSGLSGMKVAELRDYARELDQKAGSSVPETEDDGAGEVEVSEAFADEHGIAAGVWSRDDLYAELDLDEGDDLPEGVDPA